MTHPTLDRRGGRRGSVSSLTVAALPVLMGVAALVFDIGAMTLAVQRVQDVTDAAALAGAANTAELGSRDVAVSETVAANNNASPWQVTSTVHYYVPGDEVPGCGTLGHRQYAAEVVGQAEFEFSFAKALGAEQVTLERGALARAELWRNGLSDSFIFAASTDPGVDGITLNGSGNTLNGSIHSNTGVYINGSNLSVTGDVEYRNDLDISGSGFSVGGQTVAADIEEYPVDFMWQDFDQGPWDHEVSSIYIDQSDASLASGRWRVRGDMIINANGCQCQDALFVVDGDIFINGSDTIFDRVTMVAGGQIYVNGVYSSFSPFVRDLTAFSTMGGAGTAADAIWVDASNCQASGILYAPGGSLYFDGSSEHMYEVGLVAEIVELTGSASTHEGPASADSGYECTEVKLVQ
ncbi:MAG: pilus assembly protein TadG-related protein [Armatimonadota bacterium]|nr:pilus assembly protein TadG-related protein [Armatimonadota bacterium]